MLSSPAFGCVATLDIAGWKAELEFLQEATLDRNEADLLTDRIFADYDRLRSHPDYEFKAGHPENFKLFKIAGHLLFELNHHITQLQMGRLFETMATAIKKRSGGFVYSKETEANGRVVYVGGFKDLVVNVDGSIELIDKFPAAASAPLGVSAGGGVAFSQYGHAVPFLKGIP